MKNLHSRFKSGFSNLMLALIGYVIISMTCGAFGGDEIFDLPPNFIGGDGKEDLESRFRERFEAVGGVADHLQKVDVDATTGMIRVVVDVKGADIMRKLISEGVSKVEDQFVFTIEVAGVYKTNGFAYELNEEHANHEVLDVKASGVGRHLVKLDDRALRILMDKVEWEKLFSSALVKKKSRALRNGNFVRLQFSEISCSASAVGGLGVIAIGADSFVFEFPLVELENEKGDEDFVFGFENDVTGELLLGRVRAAWVDPREKQE